MHNAFGLLVFPNSMFAPLFYFLFYRNGYVLSGEIALKNNHYYYYKTETGLIKKTLKFKTSSVRNILAFIQYLPVRIIRLLK